jgi:hypothetical protein
MNLQGIKTLVTSKAGKQLLQLRNVSPTVMVGAGVVGIVATAVLASRATLKVDQVLLEAQKDLSAINDITSPSFTEEDKLQARAWIYTKAGFGIAKLYAPALTVGVVTISCFVGSHNIMQKRNASLAAAYTAVDKAYKSYRKRVQDKLGVEEERDLYYDAKPEDHVNEKGEVSVVKKASGGFSPYMALFDERSHNWSPRAETNILFLRCQQVWANERLQSRGYLFLNEVLDALDINITQAGQQVGWIRNGDGDNYVDFGIFDDEMKPEHYDFFTGRENAVWLDFNVDGLILNKI